ncbi:MAG: aldo/keto reductase, partial [Acidocella sp.]|nr:aldo/keto reductase [Acidocella sp.]
IEAVAAAKKITAAQVALAWVMAQGNDIVPIPGTKRRKYLSQNIEAVNVALTADELAKLAAVFTPGVTAGTRYPAVAMASVNR